MIDENSPPPNTGDEEAESRGGVLLAQAKAREQQRLQLWKSRVNLVKQARALMGQKMFSEAAVAYEKYIRILEIVFSCKKGERLTAEHFRESARTSELTVVASVYWDLMRIYDSSDRYGDRQQIAAEQLVKFARFTPIYPDIVRKAEGFTKSAKHPGVFKYFLKQANKDRPRCFIATSAFDSGYSVEVLELRRFRDTVLKENSIGRFFVLYYYKFSPSIACLLDKHDWAKPFIRAILRLLIKCVR
ncbi:MAG: CFI-box-CTERM domain-containing protein [Bdellovibrionota bacterium]